MCHAPQFYDGSCLRVLNTRDMSAKTRGLWSTEYRVRWPCQDSDVSDCVRGYHSDVCPGGWRRSGNDCVAPGSYVGCHSVQRFDKFGPSVKRALESACGAHFPCVSSCVIREFGRSLRNHDSPCVEKYIMFLWYKEQFRKHVVCKFDSHVVRVE